MTRPEDVRDDEIVLYVLQLLAPPSARTIEEALSQTAYMLGLLYEDVAGPWHAYARREPAADVAEPAA